MMIKLWIKIKRKKKNNSNLKSRMTKIKKINPIKMNPVQNNNNSNPLKLKRKRKN